MFSALIAALNVTSNFFKISIIVEIRLIDNFLFYFFCLDSIDMSQLILIDVRRAKIANFSKLSQTDAQDLFN
jgi:hypothetical protein